MKTIIAAVATSMLLVACGGGSPTAQYVVNLDRQPKVSPGTNAQCDAANPQDKTTTYQGEDADQILSIFEEKDGTTYAELAYVDANGGGSTKHVFTGKKNGDAYALTDTQSTDDARNPNRERIETDLYTLNLKKDGVFISGDVELEHHQNCTGSQCGNTPTIDCIYQSNLSGRKLPLNGTDAPRNPPGS